MDILSIQIGGVGGKASVAAFVINGANHAHLADNVALAAFSILTVQDSTHAHLAENAGILAVAQLSIQDATHGGAGSVVAPKQIFILPDEATAVQAAGKVYLKIQ